MLEEKTETIATADGDISVTPTEAQQMLAVYREKGYVSASDITTMLEAREPEPLPPEPEPEPEPESEPPTPEPEEEPEPEPSSEPEVPAKAEEEQPTDIIHTPSGDITRAEREALLVKYPSGIPATAVVEVVEEREERDEPLPPLPEFEGYERIEEADEVLFVKDGQYFKRMGSQMVATLEPERVRTERLYGVTGTEREITLESVYVEGMRPDEVVVAMRDAGADAATIVEYIYGKRDDAGKIIPGTEHPTAMRGAEVGQIVQGLGAQFIGFSELIGEARVATARMLGLLPEGFEELPENLQRAYGISDAAFNKEVGAYNLRLEIEAREAVEAVQAIQAKREVAIADIKEAAPGTVTTEDKVTIVDGVTTTTTVTSVVLEEALLAGVSEAALMEVGFDSKDIEAAAEFVASNTFLPNSNEWMPNDTIATIREQSEYGYDILTKQGVDAYNKALEDAFEEVAEWKRPSGYRLKPAVAAGVEKDTLSLIFPKEAVDEAWRVKVKPELIPEVEAKPVSGLPVGLIAALPIAGVVAVAEPTFVGEVVVGAIILGTAAWYATIGKDIKWSALWDEITSAFKEEIGREPTIAEVAELETIAATTIRGEGIAVIGIPQAIAIKAEPYIMEIPPIPLKPYTMEIPAIPLKPYIMEIPPTPLIPHRIDIPATPAVPFVFEVPPMPAELKSVLPQIIAAQAAAAEADDKIGTIIKPKILTPNELDAIWDVPPNKKAQALLALDAAVQDAAAAGEIDDDTLRVYQTAREEYLTRKGISDSATMTATTNMGLPEPTTIEQENMARKIALSYSTMAESQRVMQGLKSLRAEIALEAPRVFEKTVATNVEAFESDLRVYYEVVGESNAAYQAKLEALNQAINEYIGEYSPQLRNQTALAISTALNDLQQQANQAALQAYQQALTQGLTQAQAQTAAQTAAQQAVQAATRAAIQQAVKTATQTTTNTAIISAVQSAVRTAVATATTSITLTAVDITTIHVPIAIPLPIPTGAAAAKRKYPDATAVWKQGIMWKIIPPPYDAKKPMSSRTPPAGVTVLEGTPQETLMFIGGVMPPHNISFDLGIIDGFIDVVGRRIVFEGYGLQTDVGKRLPSPTKGLSIEKAKALGTEVPKTRKRVPHKVTKEVLEAWM